MILSYPLEESRWPTSPSLLHRIPDYPPFAEPRTKVFHAWMDAETLKGRFALSDDYTTWQAEVDLRAGGTYRIQLKTPDEAINPVKRTYKDVK